jgi:sugar/nucleoside kinase (ribokinase family)
VLLVTEEEACAIAATADVKEACAELLHWPGGAVDWLVIKRGAAGSKIWVRGNGDGAYREYGQRAFEVEVVDTVGCGDSFAAAVRLLAIR